MGPKNGDKMFQRLEDEVNKYNKTVAAENGVLIYPGPNFEFSLMRITLFIWADDRIWKSSH
jgi:hypothetical protein